MAVTMDIIRKVEQWKAPAYSGPASREWTVDGCRVVMDRYEFRVYMRDRVQIFTVRRPDVMASLLDSGESPEGRWRDESGNRICYDNAVPFGADGEPYGWAMAIGDLDGVEISECFETEDEAKLRAHEIWSGMSESERRPRYCLVGRIEPDYMITKQLTPVWWPGEF